MHCQLLGHSILALRMDKADNAMRDVTRVTTPKTTMVQKSHISPFCGSPFLLHEMYSLGVIVFSCSHNIPQ